MFPRLNDHNQSITMVDIFQYSEPSTFLQAIWKKKRDVNNRFSIRAWARQLDLPTHTVLYEVTTRKRKVPKAYVPIIIKYLNLNKEETSYFEAMVNLQRSKTQAEKELYQERLKKIKIKHEMEFHELENCAFVKDPLHMMILEMTHLKDFKSDPSWLQSTLKVDKSKEELQDAIDRLINIGLLKNDNQNLCKTNKHITTRSDAFDLSVQEFHKNILQVGGNQVSKQDIDQREFGSFMLNIKRESIPKAKELIRNFTRTLIHEIEAEPYEGEETYNFGIQLYAITDTEGRKE